MPPARPRADTGSRRRTRSVSPHGHAYRRRSGCAARTPAGKQEIIAAAIRQESRTELVSVLERLPNRHFGHVRDLWAHLPELPIGD
ncbi:DUF2795 domain-containing protein [Lentzea atacamensis]|uniref:DUF2795 domain-containing protein n=1 Tax=Lentzea atacamensis TaxID=531938 RepID=UPI000DD3829B